MDFIIALPKVIGNFDSIFVITDRLTKVVHLIATRTTTSVSNVAQLFMKEIVRLHGIFATIISDRDARFTSKFWMAMFQSVGTHLNLSLAYHTK